MKNIFNVKMSTVKFIECETIMHTSNIKYKLCKMLSFGFAS